MYVGDEQLWGVGGWSDAGAASQNNWWMSWVCSVHPKCNKAVPVFRSSLILHPDLPHEHESCCTMHFAIGILLSYANDRWMQCLPQQPQGLLIPEHSQLCWKGCECMVGWGPAAYPLFDTQHISGLDWKLWQLLNSQWPGSRGTSGNKEFLLACVHIDRDRLAPKAMVWTGLIQNNSCPYKQCQVMQHDCLKKDVSMPEKRSKPRATHPVHLNFFGRPSNATHSKDLDGHCLLLHAPASGWCADALSANISTALISMLREPDGHWPLGKVHKALCTPSNEPSHLIFFPVVKSEKSEERGSGLSDFNSEFRWGAAPAPDKLEGKWGQELKTMYNLRLWRRL